MRSGIVRAAIGCVLISASFVACGQDLGPQGFNPLGDNSVPDEGGYGGAFPGTEGGAPAVDASAIPTAEGPRDAMFSSPEAESADATWDGPACAPPALPGDLVIVEMMIASQAGGTDRGEWVEIRSTRTCGIDLVGLHAESPRGARLDTVDIGYDLWLPPLSSLLIADSIDPAVNHALPGPIVTWAGQPGDVLRNTGDTVTIMMGGTVIDSLTYPSLKLTVGTSKTFASSCDASLRGDWTKWQDSVASWTAGFTGTPNAPNTDVTCPP